jgi:pimeloyl-ACP methyl ester carboxylesterase
MTLLPDAGIWRKFADEVHATYRAEGVGPAMRLFSGSFVGMAGFFAMPRRPDLAQTMRNLDVFMRDEYYPVSTHVPDLDRLAAAGRPVVMAAGGASADAYYARPARLIADRLGFRYREFPGHHLSFESEPDAFAAAIRAALLAGGERVP